MRRGKAAGNNLRLSCVIFLYELIGGISVKKTALVLAVLLVLLAVSGCSGSKEWNRPAGVIVVSGEVDSANGARVSAVKNDDIYTFPLDAAMVYYFDAGDEQSYAGEQNVTSLQYSANVDTQTISAVAEAGYIPSGNGDRLFVYNLYYDAGDLFFHPSPLLSVELNDATEAVTVTPENAPFCMKVNCGTPTNFFNITCRKGEEELSFETLYPTMIQDYMKYTLPAGTDNVEITAFDADSEYIGRKSFIYGESSYSVGYDIGGRFMGAKTLILDWPPEPEG